MIDRLKKYICIPLSAGWMALSAIHRALYERKFCTPYQPKVPLISVGNLAAGGVGKTPFIDLLLDRIGNRPVAVVSRGYGATFRASDCVVEQGIRIGEKIDHDETKLLGLHHPSVLFAVSKSKSRAVKAVEDSVKMIILDDGFGHLKLDRNLNIVVLNAKSPFGNGVMREGPKALRAADLIILNYAENDAVRQKASAAVKCYCKAPIVSCAPTIDVSLPKRVALVSAIGAPAYFQQTIEECGCEVVSRLDFFDHKMIDQGQLGKWIASLRGIDAIVTTEKDALRQPLDTAPFPLIVANMKLRIVEGEELLDNLLQPLLTGMK